MKRRKSRRGAAYYLLAALCAVVFLLSCAYAVNWYSEKTRIEGEAESYRELYRATELPEPSDTPAPLK